MKIGVLLFEQFHGKKDVGSSRIRGHWLVKHWPEAEIYRYGAQYDVVIYQKAYFVEHAKRFKGVKILDLCDPDWLNWATKFTEMIEEVDAITCSSLELTKAVSKFTKKPVYFIPDRVEFDILPPPKKHFGPTKKVVWYGYGHNFPILDSCIKALSDRKLELIVVSETVYVKPSAFNIEVTNLPFSQHYLADIQKGDVVLNPKYVKGKWKYKSENKTVIAWAIGMPVAHDEEQLDKMMTEEQRKSVSASGYTKAVNEFDIKLSVQDYKDVINEIKK